MLDMSRPGKAVRVRDTFFREKSSKLNTHEKLQVDLQIMF